MGWLEWVITLLSLVIVRLLYDGGYFDAVYEFLFSLLRFEEKKERKRMAESQEPLPFRCIATPDTLEFSATNNKVEARLFNPDPTPINYSIHSTKPAAFQMLVKITLKESLDSDEFFKFSVQDSEDSSRTADKIIPVREKRGSSPAPPSPQEPLPFKCIVTPDTIEFSATNNEAKVCLFNVFPTPINYSLLSTKPAAFKVRGQPKGSLPPKMKMFVEITLKESLDSDEFIKFSVQDSEDSSRTADKIIPVREKRGGGGRGEGGQGLSGEGGMLPPGRYWSLLRE